MKKKYKLKKKVKENLIFGIIYIIMIVLFLSLIIIGAKRNQDIDSGKLILIHQNY